MFHTQTTFDMGQKSRTSYGEMMRHVIMLEGRGADYFDVEHVILIFRDVCNAVFALNC